MGAMLRPERALGATGAQVPLVGYGTAPLGKPEVAAEHAARCLNHAIDLGITYLDTSPDYGSEPHVGGRDADTAGRGFSGDEGEPAAEGGRA